MGTTCLQCGYEGRENAFVDCVQCLKFSMHRYCLETIPETYDEFVDWVCDDCEGPGQVQTRGTSKLEGIERASRVEERSNVVVTVRTEQFHTKEDCPGPHLVETNDKDATTLLAREERKSEQTCETLGKGKSFENILLKEIARDKKKKRRFEEHGNEKNHLTLGGDASAKQSHKKRKDVGTRDGAVLSPAVKQSSDVRYKRRVPEKLHESDKDPISRKHRASLHNGSADGSKKHKTGSSNMVILQEEKIEKVNRCNKEKIMPAQAQEREYATSPAFNYGEDFLEDPETRTPQPIAIPIWSGGFHILNKDSRVDGLVAHVSDQACAKVYSTACEFQPVIDFEMHPKAQVWPKSFEKVEPSGESIALYFFASEMSVNVFDRLVKDMIRKELALKAALGDAELLIFTSTELPMIYWKFQRKFYLWGVFRGKQRAPSESGSNGCAMTMKSPRR